MSDIAVVASQRADLFVENFYKYYDKQRHLLGNIYKDDAAILWNGNPYNGWARYSEFLLKLPSTRNVRYDGKDSWARPFSQTFVLIPSADESGRKKYLVASDTFRFV
ncbi:NTF2- export protein 2 [Dinochytrium kinnereticum]|nr:NTF2- export protein 2 [Dinochytrium kinnereticum]